MKTNIKLLSIISTLCCLLNHSQCFGVKQVQNGTIKQLIQINNSKTLPSYIPNNITFNDLRSAGDVIKMKEYISTKVINSLVECSVYGKAIANEFWALLQNIVSIMEQHAEASKLNCCGTYYFTKIIDVLDEQYYALYNKYIGNNKPNNTSIKKYIPEDLSLKSSLNAQQLYYYVANGVKNFANLFEDILKKVNIENKQFKQEDVDLLFGKSCKALLKVAQTLDNVTWYGREILDANKFIQPSGMITKNCQNFYNRFFYNDSQLKAKFDECNNNIKNSLNETYEKFKTKDKDLIITKRLSECIKYFDDLMKTTQSEIEEYVNYIYCSDEDIKEVQHDALERLQIKLIHILISSKLHISKQQKEQYKDVLELLETNIEKINININNTISV